MSLACLMYKQLKKTVTHKEPLYDVKRRFDVSAAIFIDVFNIKSPFTFGGIYSEKNNYFLNEEMLNERFLEVGDLRIAEVAEVFNEGSELEKLAYLEPLMLNFLVMQIADLSFKEGFVENVEWTVKKNRQVYWERDAKQCEVEVMSEQKMDRKGRKRNP